MSYTSRRSLFCSNPTLGVGDVGVSGVLQLIFTLLPARDIFRHALTRSIDVILNPAGKAPHTFTQDELRRLLQPAPASC